MLVRDRPSAYELLGVSRTAEPEIIDAAFRSLARRYSGLGGNQERLRKLEAAYELLRDPRRRRDYDATIGTAGAAIAGSAGWQVKPRAAPSESAEVADATAQSSKLPTRVAAWQGRPRSADKPRGQALLAGAALGAGGEAAGPVGPLDLMVTEPESEQPAEERDEPPLPASLQPEAIPPETVNRPPIGMALASGLAVVACVLSVPLLIGRSPDPMAAEARREATAAALAPDLQRDRTPASSLLATGADDSRAAPPQNRETDADAERRELAVADPADQADGQTTAPPRPSAIPPEQSRSSASPTPSLADSAVRAPVIRPAPGTPTAASQPQQQIAREQPAGPTPPQWLRGGLHDADNRTGRFEGVVSVSLTVRSDGRIGGCRVTGSSGNSSLDDITCRLAGQRLVFSPARDASGQAVESEVNTSYTWGRRRKR